MYDYVTVSNKILDNVTLCDYLGCLFSSISYSYRHTIIKHEPLVKNNNYSSLPGSEEKIKLIY